MKLKTSSLFKNKAFIQLLLSRVISRLGDSIDMIAYSWMVYQMTGSEILLGSIFMLNGIPGIIFSPFVGVFVDHLSKKLVAVLCDSLRGLIVLLTATLFYFNLLEIWHLFLFTFLNSTIETFESPSKSTIFSLILKDEDYLKGNSLLQSASSIAEIVGAGLAGLIIATIGISGAILIDSITFFISGILIFTLLFNDLKEESKLNLSNYLSNLKVGFNFVKGKKIILISMILIATINLLISPISVLMPVYVKNILKSDATALSYLSVSLALGSILCGLSISAISKRMKSSWMIVLGTVGIGVFTSLLSIPAFGLIKLFNPLYFVSFAFFMIGICVVIVTSPLKTYIFKHTPKDIMGRVFSLLGMLSLSALPLGGFLSGVIAEVLPVSIIFLVTGIILMVTAFIPLINKEFRHA